MDRPEVSVSGAAGQFAVSWYDVKANKTAPGPQVTGGQKIKFSVPFTQSAEVARPRYTMRYAPASVLYLKREGRGSK